MLFQCVYRLCVQKSLKTCTKISKNNENLFSVFNLFDEKSPRNERKMKKK